MDRRLLIVAAMFLIGCLHVVHGNGDVVEESRSVEGFDSISVCCGWEVRVELGDSESLLLRGDSNLLDDIRTYVRADELIVETRNPGFVFAPTEPIEVIIETRALRGFEGSGGVQVDIPKVTGTELEVELSGGSVLDIERALLSSLSVDISGGGRADVAGEASSVDLTLSGGSRFSGSELQAKTMSANLSGGSIATVAVEERIDAELSGGSVLRYFDDPTVRSEISGGSEVIELGPR